MITRFQRNLGGIRCFGTNERLLREGETLKFVNHRIG
jgi:hypothetical protein